MSERLRQYWVAKQAGLATDYIGATLTGPAAASISPVAGDVAALGGTAHGYLADDSEAPDDQLGLVPGVGTSRLLRRGRRVRKALAPDAKHQRARILSDQLSPGVNMLLLAGVGGAIGGLAHKTPLIQSLTEKLQGTKQLRGTTPRAAGVGIGALAGAGTGLAASIAALALAAIKRKRTKEEQAKAERKPGYLNHLIPGRGTYEIHKRLGASTHFDETPEEKAERSASKKQKLEEQLALARAALAKANQTGRISVVKEK